MAIRKLKLHKETLRRLTGNELSEVVGGCRTKNRKKWTIVRTEKTTRTIGKKSRTCPPEKGEPKETFD